MFNTHKYVRWMLAVLLASVYYPGNTHEPPLQHKKKAVSAFEHLPHKYMCLEPPLQRRKKPIQPHGSKSMGLNEKSDEYVLLGSQKKFAPNIIYKAKVCIF